LHWSDSVPAWLQGIGLIAVAAGYALCFWAMAVNRFFSSVVRIQTDRGQYAAFMQAVRAAEKVARYRHAQLSAIKLAGDINATVTDSASLDELIAKLKGELHKLAPIIDLDALHASRRGREPRAA
jgi:hypothetical protein